MSKTDSACELPEWYQAEDIGSIRSSNSYRPGGWWFLPAWLPDTAEHDEGPFKTLKQAKEAAEKMAAGRATA